MVLSNHQSTRFPGRLVLGTQHMLDNRLFVVVVIDTLIPYLAINGNTHIPDKQGTNKLLKMEGLGGGDGTVCFLFLFSEM